MVRNRGCLPDLEGEGDILKPLALRGDVSRGNDWHRGLKPHERMFAHHTLASLRKYAFYKPKLGLIPCDELDFVLSSPYNHTEDTFPDKIDVYLQAETYGVATWRKLRNAKDIPPPPPIQFEFRPRKSKTVAYNDYHPVLIGGVTEKVHPSYVKLMNSSHHSPQTNAGYSRQDSDGNVFHY